MVRQVRVYESYLQYVEISFTGASLQSKTIEIPKSIQELGGDNELEGRLKARLNLIEKDGDLSSKLLTKRLNKLRELFTPPIGNKERLLLKRNKTLFETRIKEFQSALEAHQGKVKEKLQEHLDNSMAAVIKHYLSIVKENIPDALLVRHAESPNDDQCSEWLTSQLKTVFPTAEELTDTMNIEVKYKDVTFETLKQPEFLAVVKRVFPDEPWDKAHKEYTAAAL